MSEFGALKQIDASVLNVGYAEAGPANDPAVLLLNGWPYDPYSYVYAAPLLAKAGYSVKAGRPVHQTGEPALVYEPIFTTERKLA